MSITFLRYFFVSIVCMCLLLCRKNRKKRYLTKKKYFCSEKPRYSKIPKGLQGVGISFIITGLMGIAFMAFMGIKL